MTTQETDQAAGTWVPLPAAASRMGVSLETIRRKVKKGEIETRKVPLKAGFKYEVWVEDPENSQPPSHLDSHLNSQLTTQSPDQYLQPLYQLLGQQQGTISDLTRENTQIRLDLTRLQDERSELYGRLGFLQSQTQQFQTQYQQLQALLQEREEELKLLKAPPEPAEVDLEAAPVLPLVADPPRPWWKFW